MVQEGESKRLHDRASVGSLLGGLLWGHDNADGFIKDIFESFLCEGRALHVSCCANGFGTLHSFGLAHSVKATFCQAVADGFVVAHVQFGADQDDVGVGAVVGDLGEPFVLHVLKR